MTYVQHGNAKESRKRLKNDEIEKMKSNGWKSPDEDMIAEGVYGYSYGFRSGMWVEPRMVYFGNGNGEEAWQALFPQKDPYEITSDCYSVCGSCGFGAVHVFDIIETIQHERKTTL